MHIFNINSICILSFIVWLAAILAALATDRWKATYNGYLELRRYLQFVEICDRKWHLHVVCDFGIPELVPTGPPDSQQPD